MKLEKVIAYLDKELKSSEFASDCSNNGLQVEASKEVTKIAFAVDAALDTFKLAREAKADLLVVHHGISWGSQPKRFTSFTAKRLEYLFKHDISLYASHLPVDSNLKFGNNIELAKMISLEVEKQFFEYNGKKIGIVGVLPKPSIIADISAIFEDRLDTKAKFYGTLDNEINRIAICSGGGGLDGMISAKEAGADLFVTGEFDHTMYHCQKELDINVISLGHYATETVGVKALMKLVKEDLNIDTEFLSVPTGL